MEISLKFSRFLLNIEHRHLKDVGVFSIICLRAIENGATLRDISNITLIYEEVIARQLKFLIEKGYIDEKYQLLDEGLKLLKIQKFIEMYGNKIEIALEHYIENRTFKEIFSSNLLPKVTDPAKNILSEVIFYYKVKWKFDDIHKGKVLEFLKKILPDEKELIEVEKDEFVFNISSISKDDSFFVSLGLDFSEFVSLLSKERSQVGIAIPVVEIKNQFSLNNSNNQLKSMFSDWVKQYSVYNKIVFNLINGNIIDFEHEDTDERENKKGITKLNKILDISDEFLLEKININSNEIHIPSILFAFLEIKKEIKEKEILLYLSEDNLKKLLEKYLK